MSLAGGFHWSQQFNKSDGTPYSGVRVLHYEPATTTDKAVYTDEARTTAAAQPVVGDSNGRVSFYGDGNYRLLVRSSIADGDLWLYDYDPIRLEARPATLRAELQSTSYPSATAANRGHIHAKVTAGGDVSEVAINKDGTGWSPFTLQTDALTGTQSLAKGADLASAATLTLGSDGNFFDVTGAVTITAISLKASGSIIGLQFDGAPLIQHNATSLILAGGVNYQTRAGDILYFQSEGFGNWREIFQSRFRIATKGDLVVGGSNHLPQRKAVGGNDTILMADSSQPDGLVWKAASATQAQQEAASIDNLFVSPGRQHYHPSAAKGWVTTEGLDTPAISASYNVTSLTDNGVGNMAINWATDFSNATHCDVAMVWSQGTAPPQTVEFDAGTAKAAGTTTLECFDNTNAVRDPNGYFCVAFGDHA